MTKEELLAKKAALQAELETVQLEKEVKELEAKKIEVMPTKTEQLPSDMQKSAQAGDFGKFQAQMTDLQAQLAKISDEKSASREGKQIHIDSYVEKEFGAKGKEVVAFAKEFAHHAAKLDLLSQPLKKDIHELKLFKKLFPGKGREDVEMALKALAVGTTNGGAEYVPTVFNDQVAQRLMDQNKVLSLLPVFDLPYNPYRMPIYTAVPTSYYVTEGATISASDPTTDGVDFDARKIANVVKYSGELEEDSILPILPFVQKTILESLSNAIERVVLMGDTVTTANTNINLIDGTPTTTAGAASVYLTRNGLIKNCFGTNGKKKDVNSDIVAGFIDTMGLMGVGGVDAADLVAFANINAAFAYMKSSSFLTWDKMGPNATLLKGMLGSIAGVQFFASSGIPLTNSAGKAIVAGGTLGSLVIVKKSGVMIGFRRRPMVKDSDILQASDQRQFVGSTRLDVKVLQPNAADRAATAYAYNITV